MRNEVASNKPRSVSPAASAPPRRGDAANRNTLIVDPRPITVSAAVNVAAVAAVGATKGVTMRGVYIVGNGIGSELVATCTGVMGAGAAVGVDTGNVINGARGVVVAFGIDGACNWLAAPMT